MSSLLTRRHVLTDGTRLAGAAALSSALGVAALLANEPAAAAPLRRACGVRWVPSSTKPSQSTR